MRPALFVPVGAALVGCNLTAILNNLGLPAGTTLCILAAVFCVGTAVGLRGLRLDAAAVPVTRRATR